MADSGTGRTLATKGRNPVQVWDRAPCSIHGDVGYLNHDRAWSARRRMWKKEVCEQKGGPPKKIVVIEQWICFLLGFICVAFGIWGICMKSGHQALSAYIAWLGSLYVPTLRVIAVVCLGFGVMLVRRGWAHL